MAKVVAKEFGLAGSAASPDIWPKIAGAPEKEKGMTTKEKEQEEKEPVKAKKRAKTEKDSKAIAATALIGAIAKANAGTNRQENPQPVIAKAEKDGQQCRQRAQERKDSDLLRTKVGKKIKDINITKVVAMEVDSSRTTTATTSRAANRR